MASRFERLARAAASDRPLSRRQAARSAGVAASHEAAPRLETLARAVAVPPLSRRRMLAAGGAAAAGIALGGRHAPRAWGQDPCPNAEFCPDPDIGHCCNVEFKCCGSAGLGERCCTQDLNCCKGTICCPPGEDCCVGFNPERGTFTGACCPPGVGCSTFPGSQQPCCLDHPQCAPPCPEARQCGSTCCPEGQFCCEESRGLCCNESGGCCSEGADAFCCEGPSECARETLPGEGGGVRPEAAVVCCPPDRYVETYGSCCPAGEQAVQIFTAAGLCCATHQVTPSGSCCGAFGPDAFPCGGGSDCCNPVSEFKDSVRCCDDRCAQTRWDPQHCGACGVVCGKDELCEAGTCKSSVDADVKGKKVEVEVGCGGPGACGGSASVEQLGGGNPKEAKGLFGGKGASILGRETFQIPAGETRTIEVGLSRSGKRALTKAGRVRARAAVEVTDGGVTRTVRSEPFALKAKRRPG